MNTSSTTTDARTISSDTLAQITSVIGAGVAFAGTFTSDQPDAGLKIEGTFEGAINFTKGGAVHLGAGSSITKGDIDADCIYIEGDFEGKLHARKALEIAGTAYVKGEISYSNDIDLHRGARVNGSMAYKGNHTQQHAAPQSPTADVLVMNRSHAATGTTGN